ncbi:MAG: hypothetical protein AAB531_03680 [Patescibacteria group bacterium]
MPDIRESRTPRIFSRKDLLLGLSFAGATIGVAAVTSPSSVESTAKSAWKLINPGQDKPTFQEQTPGSHFVSPHLGYTLENNENWTTGSDVLENGSYLDYFILDPNRTEDQPLSPQITITVTQVHSPMTTTGYAQIWAEKLYKLRNEDINAFSPAFQKGPPISDKSSTLVTTPTIGGLKFHAAIFIKDNIAYTFCYVAPEDEYYAKDENEVTNFNIMTLMRSSMHIMGAPEFASPPPKNNL